VVLSSVKARPGFVQEIIENGISAGWETLVGSNSSAEYSCGIRVTPVLMVAPHCCASTSQKDHQDGMLPTAAARVPAGLSSREAGRFAMPALAANTQRS